MGEKTLFRNGIDFFNRGYFFEAHDAFEEIWMDTRGEAVRFYQGLVQVSTGFYHLTMRNKSGALSQLQKGCEKLSAYGDEYEQIDLKTLLSQIRRCIEWINTLSLEDLTQLNPENQIPKIPEVRQ